MRKTFLLVVVLVVLLLPVCASSVLGAALDLGTVQDLALGKGSCQLNLDFRFDVMDSFQLRIPLSLSLCLPSTMLEAGIHLVYYPWQTGPFLGMSLVQTGFVFGDSSLDRVIALNEVVLGWTIGIGPFFVEPSVAIRDPSGTFSNEYASLKGVFPCYTSFRARLIFGWNFLDVGVEDE